LAYVHPGYCIEGTLSRELHGNGVEIHVNGSAEEWGFALRQGEQGTLMVRPEFVRFLQAGETADFIVRGMLRTEYALGSRIQYEVEASNGDNLTVEKLREDRYTGPIGDAVVLGWDVENTHLIRNEMPG